MFHHSYIFDLTISTLSCVHTSPHAHQQHRFDLAIQLGDLEAAHTIASALDSGPKWKQLGELAMSSGVCGRKGAWKG